MRSTLLDLAQDPNTCIGDTYHCSLNDWYTLIQAVLYATFLEVLFRPLT